MIPQQSLQYIIAIKLIDPALTEEPPKGAYLVFDFPDYKLYVDKDGDKLYRINRPESSEEFNVVEVTYKVQNDMPVKIQESIKIWAANIDAIKSREEAQKVLNNINLQNEDNPTEVRESMAISKEIKQTTSAILNNTMPADTIQIVKYFKYNLPKEFATTKLFIEPKTLQVNSPFLTIERIQTLVEATPETTLKKMNAATFQDHQLQTFKKHITTAIYIDNIQKKELLDTYYTADKVETITTVLSQLYLQTNCTFYMHASVQLVFDFHTKDNPIELTETLYHCITYVIMIHML